MEKSSDSNLTEVRDCVETVRVESRESLPHGGVGIVSQNCEHRLCPENDILKFHHVLVFRMNDLFSTCYFYDTFSTYVLFLTAVLALAVSDDNFSRCCYNETVPTHLGQTLFSRSRRTWYGKARQLYSFALILRYACTIYIQASTNILR